MKRYSFKEIAKFLRLVGIFCVFGLMVSGLWLLFNLFSNTESMVDLLEGKKCEPILSALSDKTIVLRVDDVQAFAWRETSMKMITDAATRNIPLTLGIIPLGLIDDVELVSFLKYNSCIVELGLHGLTHNAPEGAETPEFGTYSKEEALLKITEGQRLVTSITSDPIVSWIPPLNIQSEGTIAALKELGFTHLSAEGDGAFDMDAFTYSYESHVLVSPDTVIEKCKKTFETSKHCVIVLHPQDFADGLIHDDEKYNKYYLGLLDALAQEGVTFARLKDLPL